MLDIECFSYINTALEDEFAPIVIMATNRGISKTRGTNYKSPHGLPLDLLDRTIIIKTEPYNENDISKILKIRSQEEETDFNDDALSLLTKIGMETSLRYASNLIAVSYQISKKRRSEKVEVNDVMRSYELFYDSARSVQFLEDNGNQYIDDDGNVKIGQKNEDQMDTSN
ncbi:unnamed protein product [Ambrosiozyma monospora]|uniref:Unnamed protein product n=1 Tax=Ambrosiozyma monospora TaxID=43982 RepID=A0ACB5STP6_AMBMO|nr:unnamed protein product [Ambrosiozyma monospora]